MSECQAKLVWYWLSEEEETERSEVTDRPVSESRSLAEKVKVQFRIKNSELRMDWGENGMRGGDSERQAIPVRG